LTDEINDNFLDRTRRFKICNYEQYVKSLHRLYVYEPTEDKSNTIDNTTNKKDKFLKVETA